MEAFAALADTTRRRLVEVLVDREHSVNELATKFELTQPAVSQHLKVLRDTGFATVRIDGPRRLYTVASAPLQEVDAWLDRFRGFWTHRLDALATEVARGKRDRKR